MLLLAVLALSADWGTPSSTMPRIGQVPERCVPKETQVSQPAPVIGQHKLNELPDAEPRFAVVREIDGCPVPAMVRAKPKRQR
ncbi:hypothetical protein [Sphingomonas fuzhouensis]|uniref:hypothetical protein n=1 Tax=Sphingomonas fuzhouensis TaxID=3106033 RepID=UPI002AFEF434|nr:hypothetical protein [Sphingomonas sp. SGZ-02]